MSKIHIIINELPTKLKREWESGKFSFIDFLSNELDIPQKKIEVYKE